MFVCAFTFLLDMKLHEYFSNKKKKKKFGLHSNRIKLRKMYDFVSLRAFHTLTMKCDRLRKAVQHFIR